MNRIIPLLVFFTSVLLSGQELKIDKVEPPNWWTNHTYNKVQILVYGENLDSASVEIDSEYLNVKSVFHPENSNYLFVDVLIDSMAKAGKYSFKIKNGFGSEKFNYLLFDREDLSNKHNGFSNEDVVYLIFPDRFVNGNTSNDFLANETEYFEFGAENGRHGGDIEGIISKLDYLKDLGITTIWSTPLTDNNMYMSYHGYAATDLYKIDPRHGSNELYKMFVELSHEKGLKVILDHVANHIGSNHEWINNYPTETWINGTPNNHLPAEHDKVAYVDIHAGDKSITNANLGWFVDTMPDLNQADPFMAKYIIQNTIWWIEYSGIDGIREDTYPYANQRFMSEWAKEILKHYPKFNIVGEVWKGEPSILAKFQTNSYFPKEFDSNLPVVTDFAFTDVVMNYLSGKENINSVYELFGQDFVYSNPNDLLVFFDNHDTDRGMYAAKWNLHKYKVGLTLVLTTRGIPQLFYGSEIGLDGGGHHDRIRGEFPGGFNDEPNAFTKAGRNENQNIVFDFTKKLLKLRKENSALRSGELTQFNPKDNVYIYTKENDEQKIVIVINDDLSSKNIDLINYFIEPINELEDLINHSCENNENPNKLFLEKESINIYKLK